MRKFKVPITGLILSLFAWAIVLSLWEPIAAQVTHQKRHRMGSAADHIPSRFNMWLEPLCWGASSTVFCDPSTASNSVWLISDNTDLYVHDTTGTYTVYAGAAATGVLVQGLENVLTVSPTATIDIRLIGTDTDLWASGAVYTDDGFFTLQNSGFYFDYSTNEHYISYDGTNLEVFLADGTSFVIDENGTNFLSLNRSGSTYADDATSSTGLLLDHAVTVGTGTAVECQSLTAGGTCLRLDGSGTGVDVAADNWQVTGAGTASFASGSFGGGFSPAGSGVSISADGDLSMNGNALIYGLVFASGTVTSIVGTSTFVNESVGNLEIGGAYGSSGSSFDSSGNGSLDGDLVVDGAITGATGTFATGQFTNGIVVGGGYKSVGLTVSTDGDVTTDGIVRSENSVLTTNITATGTLNVSSTATVNSLVVGGGWELDGLTVSADGALNTDGVVLLDEDAVTVGTGTAISCTGLTTGNCLRLDISGANGSNNNALLVDLPGAGKEIRIASDAMYFDNVALDVDFTNAYTATDSVGVELRTDSSQFFSRGLLRLNPSAGVALRIDQSTSASANRGIDLIMDNAAAQGYGINIDMDGGNAALYIDADIADNEATYLDVNGANAVGLRVVAEGTAGSRAYGIYASAPTNAEAIHAVVGGQYPAITVEGLNTGATGTWLNFDVSAQNSAGSPLWISNNSNKAAIYIDNSYSATVEDIYGSGKSWYVTASGSATFASITGGGTGSFATGTFSNGISVGGGDFIVSADGDTIINGYTYIDDILDVEQASYFASASFSSNISAATGVFTGLNVGSGNFRVSSNGDVNMAGKLNIDGDIDPVNYYGSGFVAATEGFKADYDKGLTWAGAKTLTANASGIIANTDISTTGNLSSSGTVSIASGTFTNGATFGGGKGATGLTISGDGDLTTDGFIRSENGMMTTNVTATGTLAVSGIATIGTSKIDSASGTVAYYMGGDTAGDDLNLYGNSKEGFSQGYVILGGANGDTYINTPNGKELYFTHNQNTLFTLDINGSTGGHNLLTALTTSGTAFTVDADTVTTATGTLDSCEGLTSGVCHAIVVDESGVTSGMALTVKQRDSGNRVFAVNPYGNLMASGTLSVAGAVTGASFAGSGAGLTGVTTVSPLDVILSNGEQSDSNIVLTTGASYYANGGVYASGSLEAGTDMTIGDDLYATGETVIGSNVAMGTSLGWYDSAYSFFTVNDQDTGRGMKVVNTYGGAGPENSPATLNFTKIKRTDASVQVGTADDQIMGMTFNGANDASTLVTYGSITGWIDDPAAADHKGKVVIGVEDAGAGVDDYLTFDGSDADINVSKPLDVNTTLSVSGVATAESDLHVAGDLMFTSSGGGLAYGGIYKTATAAVTVGLKLNEWNQTTGTVFDANEASNLMTPDHTTDKITITQNGVYRINVAMSVDGTGTAGDEISFAIFKNNGATILRNLYAVIEIDTATEHDAVTMNGNVSLNSGDTIELWIMNGTDDSDIDIHNVTVSVVQIGG